MTTIGSTAAQRLLLALVGVGTWLPADLHAEQLGDPPPYRVVAPRQPPGSPGTKPPAPLARYVLVISLDGLSFSMFHRHRYALPNLYKLSRRGFWRPMASVFPSMTWNAHATLITGQYPRHHGVLGNRWIEGDSMVKPYRSRDADVQRRARTPSVHDLAAAAGWTVAALNWPTTQGSTAIRYNMPEVMYDRKLAYELLSPPLRRLIEQRYRRDFDRRAGRPPDHLAQLFGRIAHAERVETDMLVRDLAVWLTARRPRWLRGHPPRCSLRSGRCVAERDTPRLMLVHLLAGDTWMHRYGVNRWIARWSLEQADAMVGAILRAYRRAGLASQTAVLVLSDHGFAEIARTMNLEAALRSAIPTSVKIAYNGHAAFVYVDNDEQAAAVVARLRSPRYARCVEAVYAPAAYTALGLPSPAKGRDGRPAAPDEHPGAPSLVALSRPDCLFRSSGAALGDLGGRRIGFHGYLPSHPSLRAVLLGSGAGIRRRGRRPLARLTDLAPTIARLMGLTWPTRWPAHPDRPFTLDGAPLRDILKGQPAAAREHHRRHVK